MVLLKKNLDEWLTNSNLSRNPTNKFVKCYLKHKWKRNKIISLSRDYENFLMQVSEQEKVLNGFQSLRNTKLDFLDLAIPTKTTKRGNRILIVLAPGKMMAHGTFLHLSMRHTCARRSYKICKVWEVLRTLHICLTISLTLLIYQERLNVITHF